MPVEVDAGGYSLSDLWELPDDGRRRELVGGVLYVTPRPRTRHQQVVLRLGCRLLEWADVHGGQVFPGVNVDPDEATHFEPDVAVLRPGREVDDVLSLTRPPDLVVEVSSPSTRDYDLGVKRERYVAAGASEFWFVDLEADQVLVWTASGGGYGPPAVHDRREVVTPDLLPGLAVDVDDVLAAV